MFYLQFEHGGFLRKMVIDKFSHFVPLSGIKFFFIALDFHNGTFQIIHSVMASQSVILDSKRNTRFAFNTRIRDFAQPDFSSLVRSKALDTHSSNPLRALLFLTDVYK